jgi:hypothetical protein
VKSSQRKSAWAAWVAAVLVTSATTSGCFNPKIVDGGLLCADGGLCPDGYHCAADGTCKKGGPTKCQPASPHIAQICAPDPGIDCDPVCQSRCDCGRCTLSGSKLTCVPAGTKKRGDVCTPGADDCQPGNVCLADCDAAGFGRCYRFCGKGSIRHPELCDNGQDCDVPVNDQGVTDLWVCPAPLKTCNPGGNGSDCGDPALACYLDGNGVATTCECQGKKPPDGDCSVFNSCVAGYRCVAIGTINGGAPTCLKTCAPSGSDCPSGTCNPIGASAFGYCQP